MTLFQEILGVKVITLASGAEGSAAPVTVGSSGFDGNRVKLEELEASFLYDPIVFNSITKKKQLIIAAGYELRAKQEKVRNFFLKFFASIGQVGEEMTLKQLFGIIFKNGYIFGKHFVELVYNEDMTKILDLYSPDPKTIDYARDAQRRIVLDEFGRPVGYVKTLPYGFVGVGDEPTNERVSLRGNQIFLKPERIAHFKLNTFGDGFDSIGSIEPAYKSIFRKHKIDEAQANLIYFRGSSPIIDYVGSPEHWPTPDMIDKATDNLSKMQHNRYFAVPFWHNIKTLEVNPTDTTDISKSFTKDISASLGVPLALATGSGEETNRATLGTQLKFLEFSLMDDVQEVLEVFSKQILERISKLEGFKEVPEIIWGDIDAEDKNSKAERLARYANLRVGILKPEDVRPYAIKSEQLDIYSNKEMSQKKYQELSKKSYEYRDVYKLINSAGN